MSRLILTLLVLLAPTAAWAADDPLAGAVVFNVPAAAFNCYTCHAPQLRNGTIPSLNKIPAADLLEKLLAYQNDENAPTIMNRIARAYTEAELQAISEFLVADIARTPKPSN